MRTEGISLSLRAEKDLAPGRAWTKDLGSTQDFREHSLSISFLDSPPPPFCLSVELEGWHSIDPALITSQQKNTNSN